MDAATQNIDQRISFVIDILAVIRLPGETDAVIE